MLKKNKGVLIVLAIIAVFAGAFWLSNQAAEEANEGVVIEPNVKGNPDAAVELIKYSDFQCPACAAAATVVDTLVAEYGDDIRVEYRHFPLVTIHPMAIPAARATEAAAQQDAFWGMHDLLFANQQAWSSAPNATAFFIGYAEELGLDVPTFRRHLGASVIEEHVRAQFAEARDAGFTGTPTFTLNGERLQFQTYEEFVGQIEAAIAAANGTTATTSVETAEQIDVEFAL
ncbi:MAG TPA: thioredoxin domain-containing protein [Candidatus Paceibacterota bacterium]|nr:thioredoxin domain-containing protein [Candidatus Paceibacterota bacterium]